MHYHDALLARALHSVRSQSVEAFMRHVKRYYSKNFNVPLPDVDDLDEEHVLTAYYEQILEDMTPEAREEMYDILIETEEERDSRIKGEKTAESKDDEFLDNLNKEVVSGTLRRPKPVKKNPFKQPVESEEEKKEEPPKLPDIHLSFGDISDSNLIDIPPEWAEMDSVIPAKK